jgi:hypothetical protein
VLHLQPGADRPDVLGLQWQLRPNEFTLIGPGRPSPSLKPRAILHGAEEVTYQARI